MAVRLGRAEQAEVVRGEILDAARAEFLADGFHGASLDRIAARAGYTKGAVYSRYASKADLFLALLDARIDARQDENALLATKVRGAAGVATLARQWAERQRRDEAWTLLVIEFRVHAARHPDLLERYAELHRRTLDGIAEVLSNVLGGPASTRRDLAQWLFSIGNGATIEQSVDPSAFPPAVVGRMVRTLVEEER